MTFEEFKESLGTWEPKLEKYVSTKKMEKIYEFIKSEYTKNIVTNI
jgi:hypothetical protein